MDIEDARAFDSSLRELGRAFDQIAGDILSDGSRFDQKQVEQFNQAYSELRSMSAIPFDALVDSVQQLEQGKTRPFGEVMDELRRGHHD